MARDATLTIKIAADASNAARTLNQTAGGVRNFAGGLLGTAATVAKWGAVAGGAIAGVGVLTAGFASDAAESRSKVAVVFGNMAGDIEAFAKDAATSMGISEQAALEAMGTYGNLFSAMGIAPKVGADMSQNLVQLAADLASFNNITPDEALEKLRAGLVGEAEPLKSVGVNLNEARTKAKALEMGLYDGTGALDAAAKAQANYALIMEDTSKAQGDFERTSGGMANQQRILAATFQDAMADVGAAFMPIIVAILPTITGLLDDFAAWFATNGPMIQEVGASIATAIGGALSFLVDNVLPVLIAGFQVFANDILPVLASVFGDLASGAGPALAGMLEGITKNILPPLLDLFDYLAKNVLPVLAEAFGAIADWTADNWPLISATVGAALEAIVAIIKIVWPIIEAIARILFPIIGVAATALFQVLGRTFAGIAAVVTALTPIVRTVVDAVVGAFQWLYQLIARIFGQTRTPIQQFVDWLGDVWDGLADVLTAPFEAAIGIIRDVFRTIRGIIRDAVGWMEDILGGISHTIGSVVEALPGDARGAPAAPAVRAVGLGARAAPTTSVAGKAAAGQLKLSGSVQVTHRIDDPDGALERVPGGAAAVAAMLNRGAETLGLYRNIQHAAGIR